MGFWSPSLNKINVILANLYDKDGSVRVIEAAGLPLEHIALKDKPIDNWYVILREANKRGRVKGLVEFAIAENEGTEGLAQAYQEYSNTSVLLGGGAPFLPPFLRTFEAQLRLYSRVILIVLGGLIIVGGAALTAYYFLSKTTVSGVISCNDSTARFGERLAGVTVQTDGGLTATTNNEGEFVIEGIPRRKKNSMLNARFGYDSYFFDPTKFPDHDFRVIRCPIQGHTQQHPIPQSWWTETNTNEVGLNINCRVKEGVSQVKLFTLNPTPIHKTEPGQNLFLVITLPGEGQIVKAKVAFPVNESKEVLPPVPTDKERQWKIPMPGENIDIKVHICVGTTPPTDVSASLLSGYYYFR